MLTSQVPLEFKKAFKDDAPITISLIEIKDSPWLLHTNYFTVLWIQEGKGFIETDSMRTHFASNQIFCFNTYQAFAVNATEKSKAILLLFHANFFCIETYHHEVGCNGTLFNNVYSTSVINVIPNEINELSGIFKNIENEINRNDLAANELVFSYLKILLIKLTRLKSDIQDSRNKSIIMPPDYLDELSTLINLNFTEQHNPSFYSDKLNLNLKALTQATKKYYNKTVSALITEKLILKAKWKLLHTNIPIKQLAQELGFNDEYYFSRFFKKHIGLSPKQFREEEWKIRKGFLSIP